MISGLALRDLVHRWSGAIILRLLTGNQILARACLKSPVKLEDLGRQTPPEHLGHLRFPSDRMGITDGVERSSQLAEQHCPGNRRVVPSFGLRHDRRYP